MHQTSFIYNCYVPEKVRKNPRRICKMEILERRFSMTMTESNNFCV